MSVLMRDGGRGIGGNGVIHTAVIRVVVKVTAAAAEAALLMRTITHRGEKGRGAKGGGMITVGDAMIPEEDLRRERMASVEEKRSRAQRSLRMMTQRYHPAQARYPSMR